MEIEKVSPEEFGEAMTTTAQKGKWKSLLEQVKADGAPRKVSGLTRGQIAALYRQARDKGFAVKTSYKEGWVMVGLGEESE